jgi:hypothetical protein
MAALGRCMVFSLKHAAEMQHLYWDHVYEATEPDLQGLDDADNVREMAGIVGKQSEQEAGDFLTECADKVAAHWRSLRIGKITGQSRRRKLESEWWFQGRLRLKAPNRGFSIWYGASIDEDRRIIFSWLYGRGGRAWEALATKTLGKHVQSWSDVGFDANRGTIVLASIPILPSDLQGFDVDRDSLVEKVVDCFKAIKATDFTALARPVGGDED